MLIKRLKEDLERRVSEKRYKHVMGVLETGRVLGKKYGVSLEKLEIAILLHDILKEEKIEELKNMVKEYNYTELQLEKGIAEIVHGFAAAVYAREHYKIYDIDILNAVKYHTIGREGMSLLERVVYISDGIEPGRDYPEVEEIRKKVFEDLNRGILYEIKIKIEYLKEKNRTLHPNAYKMEKWLEEICGGAKKC